MNAVKWVLIDETNGPARDGTRLSPGVLAHIAEAVQAQVNGEYAAEWGAHISIRVAANSADIKPGEWTYKFLDTLPDAPGASAYHDIENGVPFAICAVSTCENLLGLNGVSVDVSHEILETAGDQGANQFAYDGHGLLHATEMCDAVEVQSYARHCADGTVVQVSNWLMRAWFNPGASAPYEYMSSAGIPGAVAPSDPLKTAPGHKGNYQIVAKIGKESEVFAKDLRIDGTRRKGEQPNWSSRAARRLRGVKHPVLEQ